MKFTAPLPTDVAKLMRALRALGRIEEPVGLPGAHLTVEALLAGAEPG